jgi:cytochrome c-type biogenesis protein CcmE
VEGAMLNNGTVEANNLLLKCPSRYEEYEEIKVEAVK